MDTQTRIENEVTDQLMQRYRHVVVNMPRYEEAAAHLEGVQIPDTASAETVHYIRGFREGLLRSILKSFSHMVHVLEGRYYTSKDHIHPNKRAKATQTLCWIDQQGLKTKRPM